MFVLGSLGLFIFGMKLMSEGIQRAASNQIRRIMRTITNRTGLGIILGFGITGILQSSSAVTVMIVSLVNAGLLTLQHSVGVIMGANIGTTLTAWIISVLEFKVNLSQLSIPLCVIGVPLLFSRRDRIKYWGEFVLGFALLFLGLDFLQSSLPDIGNNPEDLAFLQQYSKLGFFSPLVFILAGIIITVIVQSSSAAMALTLVMCHKGWIPFDLAAAMVLGENIGTTLTAEIASLVGNSQARKAARIHTLFNIFGSIWMFFVLGFVLRGIDWFVQAFFQSNSPFEDFNAVPLALSVFHTTFNILNTFVFLGLNAWLIRAANFTVLRSKDNDDHVQVGYITTPGKTSEISILEVQKHLVKYGEIVSRMSGFTRSLLMATEKKEQNILTDRVVKYEEISNRIQVELRDYLTQLSKDPIGTSTSIRVQSMMTTCEELERVANIFLQITQTHVFKTEQKIWFIQHQRERLNELFDLVDEAFIIINDMLSSPDSSDLPQGIAREINNKFVVLGAKIREEAQQNITSQDPAEYNLQSSLIYSSIYSSLDKIGNQLYNVIKGISSIH